MNQHLKHQVKFYGTTHTLVNQLFCYFVNGRDDAKKCLQRMERKGITIKAAWYHKLIEGISIYSERIK